MVIARYLPQVRTCYERELKNDPGLRGTVEVQFTIGPNGGISNARHVGGTLRNATVGDCVSSLVKRWRFPRPAVGRVDLIYPFSFAPY
jgi:outer membrane biosynthesis protein TonB